MSGSPVVIVSGPPGAGKTTVSRLVAGRFEKAVCLETDWFWTTIAKGYVPPWRPDAKPQNRVIVQSYMAAADILARGGYAVVVDGIIGPWNLHIVKNQLASSGVQAHYFVLRPSRRAALDRATSRVGEEIVKGHPALTDADPILHMWDQFSNLGELEDKVIDNTDLDADETATLIWNRIPKA
jgi:predicted kinase